MTAPPTDIFIALLDALNDASSYQWYLDIAPASDFKKPLGLLVSKETEKVLQAYKDGSERFRLDFDLHIIGHTGDSFNRSRVVEELDALGTSLDIDLGTGKRLDRFKQVSNPALYRADENGIEEYAAGYTLHYKRS